MVVQHVMLGARLCITYLLFVFSVKFGSIHYLGADYIIKDAICASIGGAI